MRDTLGDIRAKLRSADYENEEHVRLSLVARILQKWGWDVWNPKEVNAEFKPVPQEDKTKVDPALFLSSREPDIRNGFHAVEGTPLFLQYRQADRAWQCAYKLARNLGVLIRVHWLSSRTAVPGY